MINVSNGFTLVFFAHYFYCLTIYCNTYFSSSWNMSFMVPRIHVNCKKLAYFGRKYVMMWYFDLSTGGNIASFYTSFQSKLISYYLYFSSFQIARLNDSLAGCPRLKVLRVEENCLDLTAFTLPIMRDSQISTFAVEGNLFEMKKFHHLEGYEQFMERYTAAKKKIRWDQMEIIQKWTVIQIIFVYHEMIFF